MLPPLPGAGRPLAAMRLPQVFETVAAVYRANARTVVTLAAVIGAPAYLLSVVVTRALTPIAERIMAPGALAPGQPLSPALQSDLAAGLALSMAGISLDQLAMCFAAAALTRAVGRPGEPARAVGDVLRALPSLALRIVPLVGLVLLFLLGLLAAWVGLQVAMAVLLGATLVGGGGPGAFLALVAAMGVAAAATFVLVRWSLASPALALEAAGPAKALERSWRLVAGQTWRVLGYGVLVFMVVVVLDLTLVQSVAAVASLLAPGAVTGIEIAVGAVSQVLLLPLRALTTIVLFHDLRIRAGAGGRGI